MRKRLHLLGDLVSGTSVPDPRPPSSTASF